MISTRTLTASVRPAAIPLTGGAADHGALLEVIGEARLVLLGEASHGTHEFYRECARITRWLIEEKLFTIVAAEADWPDAYRANRFVRGAGPDPTAIDALANFRHFPRHDRQPPAAVQRYEKPQRTKPL